jgi:hypothetical protein
MFVNALTIESPVITVYKMAPKPAAAMVPIAYSTVSVYTRGMPVSANSPERMPQCVP